MTAKAVICKHHSTTPSRCALHCHCSNVVTVLRHNLVAGTLQGNIVQHGNCTYGLQVICPQQPVLPESRAHQLPFEHSSFDQPHAIWRCAASHQPFAWHLMPGSQPALWQSVLSSSPLANHC